MRTFSSNSDFASHSDLVSGGILRTRTQLDTGRCAVLPPSHKTTEWKGVSKARDRSDSRSLSPRPRWVEKG
eukprot:29731-Hanusia_phi.AAC.7